MDATASFRYEQLAQLVADMVDNGALPPGARAPSVRALAAQHGVSISTAMQAYRLLEDRGVLVARPQSGFYVAVAHRGALALPSASRPRAKASTVAIGGAVAALLEHASNSSLLPLGCAVPEAALLQARKLDLALARAARRHGTDYNVYGPARGDPGLRREIARRAMRLGHALSPEDVLLTNGCSEALMLALTAVADRGDTIAVESPTYFGLLHMLEVLGMKALEVPTHPTRGIDVDALARLLDDQPVAACLVSSCFGNPLGSTMDEADKRALLALLAHRGLPLIEDDVYGEIHFGRERPKPFIALDGGADTIYCSSFSKCLAPGYRVGWIATRRHAQRALERKTAFSLCGPLLPQVALADFLAGGAYDAHLRRMRRTFEHNLAQLSRAVELAFPAGTKVSRPAGGFVLWVELAKGFDSRALFDEALDLGICFAPGDVFSANRRYRHCLRLSAGYAWNERLERGVQRLGQLARRQLARQD